ncbi:MAG: response regulator [Hungatella sp.]|nr:response regulator [Hungatella sp.]
MIKEKNKKRKKSTIFKIFLVPLIGIMLIQSMTTMGTLVVRRTTAMLEEYSSGMMGRLVENRGMILQNEMNQRWASVHEQEASVNEMLQEFLARKGVELNQLLDSEELKNELLEQLFPRCLTILQNNSTTGIFVILTGGQREEPGEYDGFFIRDSDPDTNPVNFSDLLLERGSKHLSREWNIPLDTSWTTRFHMSGQGRDDSQKFFYEPWRAGETYMDADIRNLGYWATPFFLEKGTADSYEMITYSLPLRYEGRVYGILGVEISSRNLYDYFPVAELNESQQSGYMLAVKGSDNRYTPLVGKGILYNEVRQAGSSLILQETNYDSLSLVEGIRLNKENIYAVEFPLKLYGNNSPYEDTQWALLGLDTQDDLFGMSRQLYVWMVAAVLVGLLFGVIGIYLVVRHLTKPVQHLMQCISGGSAGLTRFKSSNILEIDALYEVVNDLTNRQKEAENILLEEKERYRVALESSKDIFFSYDPQKHILDIVNHKTMSGRWECQDFESGFINPDYIYDLDRESAIEALQSKEDRLSVEFRLKWPEDAEYIWVLLSGKAVYDTDGRRRKLVGSIRDIQEQKKREEEQRRKNTIDAITGLYIFSAGMEELKKCRGIKPDGVMVNLFLKGLKGINEKNGIVFGDMVLEEVGNLLRVGCRDFAEKTGRRVVVMRLDGDDFVVWLEEQLREPAAEFVGGLIKQIETEFEKGRFTVTIQAGLVIAEGGQATENLICMARLAKDFLSPSTPKQYGFFEDIPESSRKILPPLMGRDIISLDYNEDVSLVSLALNLFGRGTDFPAQMMFMIRKIGKFYEASDVLVSVLRADFNSNYLDYQWHREGEAISESVRKYREEERETFYRWLGQREVLYISKEDSRQEILQCFLSIAPGQYGVMLPMYDNGSYMGNICILGLGLELMENPDEYQELAEIGQVIQSQLNQQQHDIASKAKSEFLSRMSHEIRTPMNGIIGMTAIALQPDQSQERIMDCLQKIQSSSDYLLGLINDILDMSKIESGKMKLEPLNFNMYDMLDTIRELITPQAAVKDIRFVQDIGLTHTWFVADRMRISQVLINLLGNAVKFTPQKGVVTLTIREEKSLDEEGILYFAVQDTGIGIEKADQERVFRSFEQSSGPNPSKQQGTGLGLSISSRLVQMMGSNIRLDSELGEGSTFSFTISLKIGESMEIQEQQEEISFEGCHILVVEDNELNAEIAQSLLEERNFEVDCVYDGAQAVERIKNTEPGTYDVILMDIMMPVMDGLEATRTIRAMEREDCHTIPIVAMSANAFDDDLKKSVECGMNGHLSKPVEVDKLYQTLGKIIQGRKKS